jgi:hypothetical protein
MAYYDRTRWYHVWCNVNEGIVSAATNQAITPSGWKFLGSRVLNESSKSLVISSNHEVTVDGVPLRIDRYMYLKAGDTHFVLTIKITNVGTAPTAYLYLYGDEPWVGNYGSSRGNVGWLKDQLVKYETKVDSTRHSYAGFYDYGNDAAGEEHRYTGTANFIEWFGSDRPMVYFANEAGHVNNAADTKVPLASNARFLGLVWGPQVLAPRQTVSYTLAVGMAGHDPKSGFPVKPEIRMDSVP